MEMDVCSELSSPGVGRDADFRAQVRVKAVDAEQRRITAVASREMIDRDGEVVSLAALRAAMKEYMQNPVILASHTHRLADGRSPVVGKVIDYTFTGRDLVITVEFAQTELGEEYWRLYKDKFQRAFSIGFIGRSAPVAEVVDGRRVRVWKDIELLEISCVAVPANPAALSKQRLSWGQRKKIEREQKQLWENPVRLERLFARYEKLRNEQIRTAGLGYGEDVSEEVLRKHFSDAEISMIHDVCRYDPAWGFGDPEERSFEEDYAKYI